MVKKEKKKTYENQRRVRNVTKAESLTVSGKCRWRAKLLFGIVRRFTGSLEEVFPLSGLGSFLCFCDVEGISSSARFIHCNCLQENWEPLPKKRWLRWRDGRATRCRQFCFVENVKFRKNDKQWIKKALSWNYKGCCMKKEGELVVKVTSEKHYKCREEGQEQKKNQEVCWQNIKDVTIKVKKFPHTGSLNY